MTEAKVQPVNFLGILWARPVVYGISDSFSDGPQIVEPVVNLVFASIRRILFQMDVTTATATLFYTLKEHFKATIATVVLVK